MFHLLVSSLYDNDCKFKTEWDKIPYICNMDPHLMWFSFSDEYNEKKWKHILNTSNIHKLSWKIDSKLYPNNTICKHILNDEDILNEREM